LVQLQKGLADIEATGTKVIGISYDSVEILRGFSDASNITFPLLSDADSATIKAYGLHFKEGLPHPGTYLVGKDRTVLAALFLEGYLKRHENSALIEAARAVAAGTDGEKLP